MATESSDSNANSNKLTNGAPPGSGPRKATSMFNSVKRELYQLAHPYYIINLILGLSFLCLRLIPPVCYYVFGNSGGSEIGRKPEDCELDTRENEILFFLLIVVMIRSRKTGASNSMTSYFASGFVYAKVANLILFFRTDPRYGLLYLLLFTLQAMLLPEPTYKGPESIIYFRATGLDEELSRDPRVTWLVTFYAAWSPSCVNFSPVFSQLSAQYALPNLKFGKIDVGRYPDVAQKFHISTTSLTRQLPTVILFQEGKETGRAPAIISGKVQKFLFKEEDIINTFDLNNLYTECKKDKRYAAQLKQQLNAAEELETKKEK